MGVFNPRPHRYVMRPRLTTRSNVAKSRPMSSLKEMLGTQPKRDAVIDDACRVLDQEVADKSGISGLAIKAAFKVVQGIKPGFIREVIDHLLNDFLDALNPMYQAALATGADTDRHFVANAGSVADSLLAITDARVNDSSRSVIKKTYEKLRPTAKKQVEAAAPRLGALLKKHT